jgi:hypothetical protein
MRDLLSIIVSGAAAIASFFGLFHSFLTNLAPPVEWDGHPFSADFAQFFVCLAVLILYVVILAFEARIKNKKATPLRYATSAWLGAAVVTSISAFSLFLVYQKTHNELVFLYPPKTKREAQTVKVAGLERSKTSQTDPELKKCDNAQLLFEWQGDEAKAWDPTSIFPARQRLLLQYLAFTLFSALAFFSLAETARINLRGEATPHAPHERVHIPGGE